MKLSEAPYEVHEPTGGRIGPQHQDLPMAREPGIKLGTAFLGNRIGRRKR